MSDEIAPALSPEQWRTQEATAGDVSVWLDSDGLHVCPARSTGAEYVVVPLELLPAVAALANLGRPDSDRGKQGRRDANRLLNIAAELESPNGRLPLNAPAELRAVAAKILSILPPDGDAR